MAEHILDYIGQISKITSEMHNFTKKIAKNELLHETFCLLVEIIEIFVNPIWPPHDFDLFDHENGSRSNIIIFSDSI